MLTDPGRRYLEDMLASQPALHTSARGRTRRLTPPGPAVAANPTILTASWCSMVSFGDVPGSMMTLAVILFVAVHRSAPCTR